jgi:transposase-like protein
LANRFKYSAEVRAQAVALARDTSIRKAAGRLGIPTTTISNWIAIAEDDVARGEEPRALDVPEVSYPTFPDDDLPTEELIEIARRRNRKRLAHAASRKWYPIKVNIAGPIAVAFIGDPHVDDDGCNWDLLYRDCALLRDTEGAFAVNVGDTTNNWVGRLSRLFANQEASQETARKFARWMLADSGVRWLTWIMGNHDLWNEGEEILRRMRTTHVPMEDHQAQFDIVFPNKRHCRTWVAHQFPGNSMWNSLHGHQRAAHLKSEAHIYAAGHTHNWAIHQEESASRDFTYWLLRARGYKFVDDFAEKLGHHQQQEGATITAVIDPEAKTGASYIQCFADLEPAMQYLGWLRGKVS